MSRMGWFLLTLALIFASQTTQADYQAGLDAYNKGNYDIAMQQWQAVAAKPPGTLPPATLAEANYAIGMLYWTGQSVTMDYFIASQWLQKAADMGHAGAQGKLGYLYTEGIAVQKNYETAFDWFSKAAKQGDIDGQYNLGIFYLNGWGTEKDKTMAAQYLAAASAQGDPAAEAALQDLLPKQIANNKQSHGPSQVPDRSPASPSPSEDQTLPKSNEVLVQTPTPIQPTAWILTQNPNHYTIQVIGLRSKPALLNLINGYDYLAPFATYTLIRKNQPLHLLIQGVYPSVELARKARDKFPTAIQKPKDVWIRKFAKVQELVGPDASQ